MYIPLRNFPLTFSSILNPMKLARLASVFFVLLAAACSQPDKPVFIDPAFSEFIATYTAGVVQSSSSIRIVMAKDVADSTMVGQEATAKLFEFKPSLKGKAVWLDSKTIEFKPEQRMPSGQKYEVTFLLSRLMTVADNLSEFVYSFQVVPQNFDLVFDNVKPYVKTELTKQKIEGGIITADFAEKESVEKVLAAKQEGRALNITWVHNNDGKVHSFVIEDVARKENASSVKVAVDGSTIGVKKQLEEEVEIPSLNDFKLMSAKVVQNPSQHVVLQFSDPLKEKQNLLGLVTISDDPNMTLEFDVHDNEIWVYPPVRQTGTKTIRIEPGVRNVKDYRLIKVLTTDVEFEQTKPQVTFTTNGNILPSTDGLVLPFQAVNLRQVDVSVSQVFESNILQFMQVNNIDGNYEMRRVGRPLLTKTIQLDNTGVVDLGKWNRFTLDLTTLINAAPGNIYSIKISFKKEYAAYQCDADEAEAGTSEEGWEGEYEYSEYESDYYTPGYDWEQRDNPCHVSYYTSSRFVSKNVLASDLGLMAKSGSDGELLIFANDLKSAKPSSGIELEFYDFQQQLLGTAKTDNDGKAAFQAKERPFALIAKQGAMRGYLRLNDGESLSMSGFDVSGEYVSKGLKGFLYGERGVWRPGDSLFLNFMLEDKSKTLPANHPVVFELQNPQGVVANRQVKSSSENGFYFFGTATSSDAPTGNWLARVKVGGTDFTQTVKIETVKPNRLKINLDLGAERLTGPDVTGNLSVKWLHGAPGKNLKAEFEYSVYSAGTSFKTFDDYIFEDVSFDNYSQTSSAWEGQTDSDGRANFAINLSSAAPNPPGFMNVVFKGKVFEESGNFSIDRFSIQWSPYSTYVGFQYRDRENGTGMLYTNTDQHVDIVTVNADGKPVNAANLEVKLYALERYWWWDSYNGNLANYIEQNASSLIKSETVSTVNGKASFTFKVAEEDWGTYYFKVTDTQGGHVAASTFYIDMPGYYGRNSRENKTGATQLTFNTDKKSYSVGDKVKVNIPGSEGGRALVSIENGRKVLSSTWIETSKGENTYSFEATSDMAPNVFVHVTLLQPHAQTTNDLPIRLYGVVPIGIEDAKTHIEPVITMPAELEPNGPVKIVVSEKSKRKMTYTLAVVDEGLLDLTRFQTPDPWNRFYAREALGVKTWDLYDRVMGAFGGNLERLLALGGSDAMMAKNANDPQANRFKAVVKFFGPITIEAGETSTLSFKMPQYVGSVKTMVVAGYEGAYGKAEKVTPVRKPLMVLATLPRVVGPTEKVRLPVTLFASDKRITKVKVDVKTQGPLVALESSKTIDMPASGDITLDFDLDVKPEVGVGKVTVTASSGTFTGADEIEINVRNPNPPITQVRDQIVEAGKYWEPEILPIGMNGTNGATLEVSTIPPINLGYRLKYLIEYPHGCIEQTTSSVFPQLYLDVVRPLTDREKTNIKNNITKGIERIKLFVTSDGGFGYWPGNNDSDAWGSTYAGHFLLEAEAKGYYVPGEMIKRWKKYQKNRANEWRNNNQYNYWDYVQAYRLYTLALAGAPELPAMNRLRESKNLTVQAGWMLAATYAKAGQPEVAKKIIAQLTTDIKPYQEMGYSYGSDIRDKAMIMETFALLDERPKALNILKDLSKALSNQGYWMSTQTTAFCLKAIGSFMGSEKRGELKFSYSFGGKDINASTDLPMAQATLPITNMKPGKLKFTNQSGGVLYVRVLLTGTPAAGLEKDESNELFVATSYTDSKGIAIDPARLEQGTEFFAKVTVKHMGYRSEYRNMALTQIFPSGWEIDNARLTGDENLDNFDRGDYQDIRDDRAYTYFSLYSGQTRTFTVRLTASYAGQFYLPAVNCEAMYDNTIYGRTKGMRVEVVKASGI
jgi:uncharacterized protein YfaS (alpha-2-macroglobulin family)